MVFPIIPYFLIHALMNRNELGSMELYIRFSDWSALSTFPSWSQCMRKFHKSICIYQGTLFPVCLRLLCGEVTWPLLLYPQVWVECHALQCLLFNCLSQMKRTFSYQFLSHLPCLEFKMRPGSYFLPSLNL